MTRSESDVALSRSNPTERSCVFVFPQRGTRLSPFLSPSPHLYGSRLSRKQVGARFLLSVVLFSQESDQCADSSDPDSKLLMQTGLSYLPPNSTSFRQNSSSTPFSQTRTPVFISSSISKLVSRQARPSIELRFIILQTFCGDTGSTSGFNPEARDRDIPFTAKDEPATLPRVQELVIICESSPWCTIVKNERGVTLLDVCTTIWKECARLLCCKSVGRYADTVGPQIHR